MHRHIRSQYACRSRETITAEPIPAAVIDGSAGGARLAGMDRNPEIPGSSALIPHRTDQRAILHVDETPLPQLDPGNGKTKRAYLWAYQSNDFDTGPPIIVFDYQTGRSGSHAQDFLDGRRGSLMVDDYSGYKALFRTGMVELACLAHARRKFSELHVANQSPIAAEALKRIGELYAIESAGKGFDVAHRLQLRQHIAQPKLDDLHAWLLHTRRVVAEGSGIAKAITIV